MKNLNSFIEDIKFCIDIQTYEELLTEEELILLMISSLRETIDGHEIKLRKDVSEDQLEFIDKEIIKLQDENPEGFKDEIRRLEVLKSINLMIQNKSK